ncbi:MAG TPA: hypothetical protein DD738_13325, partial [Ruminiclostridium sp.]|nr:hypothetical protein [Ruminiclostridium sp.]
HEIKFLKYKEKDAHAIIKEMKANGCQFAFDLDVADFRPGEREFIKYIDYIFVNEIGFENLNKELDDEMGIHSLFASGAKLLVKTLAENGVEIIQAGKTIAISGHTVDVVDVTGAGDTFCSTFVYMLSKTDDYQLAGEFANYAAARSVMGLGARYGAAGIKEVLQFIKEQGGDTEKFALQIDNGA